MTFAASSIIGEDGMLNYEDDLLENAALKESEWRDVKRRRDAQQGPKGYSAYDDGEFECRPVIGGNGAATDGCALHHEVIDQGKDQKGKAVMEIEEHGVTSADCRKRADEVRARLRHAFARRSPALLLAPLFALRPFLASSPRVVRRPALCAPLPSLPPPPSLPPTGSGAWIAFPSSLRWTGQQRERGRDI